ncbi:MAG: hypothetical protein P4L84_13585 [Isosphaeraceae bacterium]|nr:hypothetical protein [Isosphaeraceae bacterium]
MLSILFWNLDGKPHRNAVQHAENLVESIARLTLAKDVDILVFAECGVDDRRLIERLNATGLGPYDRSPIKSRRVRVFTRLEPSTIAEAFSDPVEDRLAVIQIETGASPAILLAGVHFHDRMSIPTDVGRALATSVLARTIESVEDEAGHQRTALVGDLNMNPFEGGVVGTHALHGVMTRALARSVPELASRKLFRCFYNPMWGLLGDRSKGPAGTYYFPNLTDPANHFWNVFDQVLLRPALMDHLVDLEVLASDGTESFITKGGRPRRAVLSDHLPLFFRLDV